MAAGDNHCHNVEVVAGDPWQRHSSLSRMRSTPPHGSHEVDDAELPFIVVESKALDFETNCSRKACFVSNHVLV